MEDLKTEFSLEINFVDPEQLRALAFDVPQQLDEDLMFVHFILNHEGSNSNHDVFDKELMKLRAKTVVNKPIDIEHKQPIIGVVTDARYIEPEGAKAYIECVGVIWKKLYPQVAETVKEYYTEGKVKMSMEAWFKNPLYIVGDQKYDFETAYAMGICDANRNLRALTYNGEPCYRKFTDFIYGGVAVTTNPADKEAVLLAVAKDMSIKENLDDPNEPEEEPTTNGFTISNENNIEFNSEFEGKIAFNEGFFEVYESRFGIFNSQPIFDKRSDSNVTLKELSLKAVSALSEQFDDVVLREVYDDYLIIEANGQIIKAHYNINENNDVDISKLVEGTYSFIENVPNDNNKNLKGSEDGQMDIKQIQELLKSIAEKIGTEDYKMEDLTNELSKAISGLSEIEVSSNNEPNNEPDEKDRVLAELKAKLEAKASEVDELKTQLENVDTLKERAEKAEAELQELKDKIAKEEQERQEIALASERMKELEEAGIVFTDEKKKERAFARFRTMSKDEFVEYKEELLEIKATLEKNIAKANDNDDDPTKDDDDVDIDNNSKAKASLNLEAIINMKKDLKDLWKPSNS